MPKISFTSLRLCGRLATPVHSMFFLIWVVVTCAGCATKLESTSEPTVRSKKPTVFVVN
jgi:hypothetical protein